MRVIGKIPSSARKTNLTASGALPDGSKVIVNSNGTISAVDAFDSTTVGTQVTFGETGSVNAADRWMSPHSSCYDIENDRIVIAAVNYLNNTGNKYGIAFVGQIIGNDIVFGPLCYINSTAIKRVNNTSISLIYHEELKTIIAGYARDDTNQYGYALMFRVLPETNILSTQGGTHSDSTTQITSEKAQEIVLNYNKFRKHFVYAYVATASSFNLKVLFCNATANAINQGSLTTVSNNYCRSPSMVSGMTSSNGDRVIIAWGDDTQNSVMARGFRITSTGLSQFGTAITMFSNYATYVDLAYYPKCTSGANGVVIIMGPTNKAMGVINITTANNSTTTIAAGSGTVSYYPSGSNASWPTIEYDPNSEKILVAWNDQSANNTGLRTRTCKVSADGQNITDSTGQIGTLDPEVKVVNTGNIYYINLTACNNRIVVAYNTEGSNTAANAVIPKGGSNIGNSFIGVPISGAADGESVEVITQGGISSNAFNRTYTITVQNVSGNKYFIDGVQQDTLTLYRGNTYIFDQSDSSNALGGSTHPFKFATSYDAAPGGANAYTTGVTSEGTPGQAGAFTKFVVPLDAPGSLYYYCSNHNAMGSPNPSTILDVDIGSIYYVQTNGTIGPTPHTGALTQGVPAGVAISPTELIVKSTKPTLYG